jgi:murein DD-endopeptidase MepM/ murein hydrolase activator NlpD
VQPDQTRLFLCHLTEGSVAVTEGQPVSAGDVLGLVGNSGRSTEPHLHLHAVGPDGTAMPLLIEGKAPWRGRLLGWRDR